MIVVKIATLLLSLSIPGSRAGTISESLSAQFNLTRGRLNCMIELPDISLTKLLEDLQQTESTRNDIATQIVNHLKQQSAKHQAPIIKALSDRGLSHQTFWIANRIHVDNIDENTLQLISNLPHDFIIREPYKVRIFPVIKSEESELTPSPNETLTKGAAQWGVAKINAPSVWNDGYTGQGVVVGTIDSGVSVYHSALNNNYRTGQNSWYDAVGGHPYTPYDGHGHGTHTAGIAVGAFGIGVAPGAKWMACRALDDQGSGTENAFIYCGQFMQCPTVTSGTCSGMPDVVSNSWGGDTPAEKQNWYQPVIYAWRASGIIPIFAIGNSGPSCSTTGNPGNQPNSISVGSTNSDDTLSSFSSRGPYGNQIKPEVSAPGGKIVSADAFNANGYVTMSGTSMAAPHVAGAVALILSAHPSYQYNDVYRVLTHDSVQPALGTTQHLHSVCANGQSVLAPNYPNNGYGYGRIDVQQALGL